jgi:hypothetical protein
MLFLLQPLKDFLARSKDDGDEAHANLSLTARVLTLWIAGSLVSILLWSTFTAPGSAAIDIRKVMAVFGQAIIVAGGAFAVGTLFGFLFGIPRTLQDQGGAGTQATSGSGPLQATNTNLEQISDWLTKILVGVGLTQLNNIRHELRDLGNYFAIGSSPAVTLAMVLNFSVAGFLTGYLLTRLFLTGAFLAVERSLRELTKKAEQLQEAGKFGAALNRYETALEKLTSDTPPEERQNVFEGLIFNSLYESEPRGFERAIAYGDQYLRGEKGTPKPQILAFLAGAYGQQYKYERDQKKALPVRLDELKAKALEAARRAIDIDPAVINLLRMMWDPKYPGKSPGDDDLEVFVDDPEFKKLLGTEA